MTRTLSPARLVLFACALLAAAPAFAKLAETEWNQAKKDLETAIAGEDTDAIVRAIAGVAVDGTRRAADLLIAVGTSDKIRAPAVYDAILDGLRGLADPEAQEYLVESLERKTDAKSWPLRSLLCEALVPVPGPAVTKAIASRLKDSVPYVVSAAARALGKRLDKNAVEPLIRALEDLEKKKDVPWVDVRAALTAICGYDFPTAKEWERFWTAEGKTFDPATTRGNTAEPTTVLRDEARFFSEVIPSKRIMFVIDVSGSMREKDIPVTTGEGTVVGRPPEKASRLDVVKKALIDCVKGLRSDVKFNIIAFSTGTQAWRPATEGLRRADDAAKADAVRWISALEADGATETDKALEEAFKSPEVNTIILLSDGQPVRARGVPTAGGGRTRGYGERIEPREILDKVRVLNRFRGVKIHTFCFKVFDEMRGGGDFDPQECLEFLRELAEENGGKLTKV